MRIGSALTMLERPRTRRSARERFQRPSLQAEGHSVMAMVCPQCKTSFDQRLQCPHCDVRLIYHESAGRAGNVPLVGAGAWQQTPWGRIFIGLLLAQGLYYGLRHLCVAALLAVNA